jgi:hypothetical protein
MSNKTKAQGLIALALDIDRSKPERLAAFQELNELKKKAKVGWGSLLGHQASGSDDPNTWQDIKDLLADDFDPTILEANAVLNETDPLEEPPADEPIKLKEPKAKHTGPSIEAVKPKPAKREPEVRGKISERIRELLKASDDPYDTIRETVCKEFPHAVTTNRSLASVASELRGKGEKIAPRRKAAKKEG